MVSVDVHINPLMPGGNKNVTYLSKPAVFSCRFVWVCVTLLPPGIKGLKNQSRIQRVYTPIYRFGRPNYMPKSMKNSHWFKCWGIKYLLYLSIVKYLTLRYLWVFCRKKAIKQFLLRFNQFLHPILNRRLLYVVNITIHFDAL